MSNIAILTDEVGNFIGQKSRFELKKGDMVAVSFLWVENSNGEVLIAQRSLEKTHDPGLWGPTVGGTLEPGETFESNIIKEAEEEIGLPKIEPEEIHRMHYWRKDGTGRYSVWFRTRVDLPVEKFKLQHEEVAEVKWIDKESLARQTKEYPDKFAGWPERWQMMLDFLSYSPE